MPSIRTLIVDDEPKAIDVIRRYCEEVDSLELLATFRDPVKALAFLSANPTDLIFLDINMPKLSGLEFLDTLDRPPRVIFTTAYGEYAIESYEYAAIDYLLKPIDFQRFIRAVTKAQRVLSHGERPAPAAPSAGGSDQQLYIKSGSQLHRVHLADVLYLEKEGNYLTFHTRDRRIVSRQNMKDMLTVLDADQFVRVHKSFVVALAHVDTIERHQLRIGKATVPLGRSYREAFFRRVDPD